MHRVLLAFTVALGLAAAACSVSTPSDNRVESITGSVAVAGTHEHSYTFSRRGESFLRITNVNPTINGSLYVGIGIIQNGICSLFTASVQPVVLNREITFGLLDEGTYCLQIFDPGVLVTTTTYTGTFSYP
jgi:hypothetical protein